MKKAFACHSAADCSDLKQYLKNEHNIHSESGFHFKDRFVIFVSDEDYLDTIKYGRVFLENTELALPTFYYDLYNNIIPLNFIPYLEIKFPKERLVERDWWVYSKYPIDIETFNEFLNFRYQLKQDDIKIFINYNDNALLYYLNKEKKDKAFTIDFILENTKIIIEQFLSNNMLGIEEIKLYSIENNIKKKEELTLKHFSSYLKRSFFIRRISDKKIPESTFIGGYKASEHKKFIDEFKLRKVESTKKDPEREKVYGNFIIRENKRYDRYHNSIKIKNGVTEIPNEPFVLIDNGDFKMDFWITNHSSRINEPIYEINIETKVKLLRNVIGYDYENNCIEDNLFQNIPHSNTTGEAIIKEHFRVIKDQNILLHYSDNTDEIEIIKIPNDWQIKDGINNFTYFDSLEQFYKEYNPTEEINVILNSREENDLKKTKKRR